MKLSKDHTLTCLIYTVILAFIYHVEIVPTWSYMGFSGSLTWIGLVKSIFLTVPFAFFLKVGRDVRSYILISCFYLFVIPSAIYISLSDQGTVNIVVYFVSVLGLLVFSGLGIRIPPMPPIRQQALTGLALALVAIVMALQAAYGGLENFSLDIERVYEFRRETADNLPQIFAYVYSNVASVLLPILLVFAYIKRSVLYFSFSISFTLILFGMSHHKSVLFSPPVALLLYIAFSNIRAYKYFPALFLLIPIISVFEIFITREFGGPGDIAYLTSLIVRRVLFVPAMLDSKYIEFFSYNPFYYWSSSRLFSWAGDSGYNLTAPFIIGYEYFRDLDTSANTGIVGSGFSNAGILGVLIYSTATGVIVSLLNGVGSRLGHAFVAAVSFVTIFNILSSADLLTSFLTHGLLLLVLFLAFSPADIAAPERKGARV